MARDHEQAQLQALTQGVRAGRLSRRHFIKRIAVLGVSAPAVGAVLAACGTPAATAVPPAAPTPTKAPTTAAAPTSAPASGGATATAVPGGAGGAAATSAPRPPAGSPATAGSPAASGGAPASAGGGTTTGVTDTEVVIGSWGPQSGPAAAYGIIDRTLAGFFKKVNDDGGVSGRKIKFVYEDDGYQPSKTQAVVKKLVEDDKVFAFVNGLGTPNNLAVMDYLVQNNVPHVAPATGSTAMSTPLKRNVFALQTNYIVEATLVTRYAIDTFKSKKFAVFYQNDAFGKEGFDSVNAELKKQNLPEAVGVTYETADTNFSAQALKLQTTGADTVVLWAVPKPGGSVLAELDKIGFKPKLVSSAVINDPSIFQLAGPGIDGMIAGAWLPDYLDTSDPKVVAFRDFMSKNLPNEQIGGFAESGYAAGQLLVEALKRTGKDLTRERFIQTMESIKDWKEGIVPNISYSADNHQGANALYFQRADAKEGKFIKITDFIEYKP